jgi:ribosomal protein S18 acetylase RimI-like enzyme
MLNGRQAGLAVARGAAVRIDPGYGPFAAARDSGDEAQAALARAVIDLGGEVWLTEPEDWPVPPGLRLVSRAHLIQMVAEQPAPLEPGDGEAVLLDEADVPEMTELALATRPGPWGPRTHRYGQFYGIRRGGRLLAMAGQRMLPAENFEEVSGVCTWPDQRGQGLAGRLIRRVMASMVARGVTPFLHSYAANSGAIALYESLGFQVRRQIVGLVLEAESATEAG